MDVITIDEAEKLSTLRRIALNKQVQDLQAKVNYVMKMSEEYELLMTQIASARIDGKKEFDADSYMKPKKKG